MVTAQPEPNGPFRAVSHRITAVPLGANNTLEIFSTTIENAVALDQFKPANLVDFRSNANVPEWLRDQGDPNERWQMLAALRGIEVGYSKEFINWKLWDITQQAREELCVSFSDGDPCYLSDYGKLGLAAKSEAEQRKLSGEDRFLFCIEYILERVEATSPLDLGLFGAWLTGAKIDPSYVKQTVREALTN